LFSCIILDPAIVNGNRVERRVKQIEENTEFEITDISEVEFTPSESECTTQDFVLVPKSKQNTFMQLLLPGVIEQVYLIRNRVLRAIHCKSKSETRQRHFLFEINEQPCEIRPIASEGSTELRYLHSTQNLYDYMSNYGNDTFLYVKLLRGKIHVVHVFIRLTSVS
jgi:tRNA(Ile2) C34 agmatinyltransferase TiaS